jgi:hypothetical protein
VYIENQVTNSTRKYDWQPVEQTWCLNTSVDDNFCEESIIETKLAQNIQRKNSETNSLYELNCIFLHMC